MSAEITVAGFLSTNATVVKQKMDYLHLNYR